MLVSRRRGSFALLCSLLAALAIANSSGAQPRVEEKANIAITGDIEAVDVAARKLTLLNSNDESQVFDVEGAATIMYENRKIGLGDLVVGWNVAANGHELRGNRTLTYIKVVKSPTP